jgi:ribosomal protein L25 (general stress protein Ctc)
MREREILSTEVLHAIEASIRTTYNQSIGVARALRANGHLLIVVFSHGRRMKVITVIDTSKIKKYLDL